MAVLGKSLVRDDDGTNAVFFALSLYDGLNKVLLLSVVKQENMQSLRFQDERLKSHPNANELCPGLYLGRYSTFLVSAQSTSGHLTCETLDEEMGNFGVVEKRKPEVHSIPSGHVILIRSSLRSRAGKVDDALDFELVKDHAELPLILRRKDDAFAAEVWRVVEVLFNNGR